jgi:MFS family permease
LGGTSIYQGFCLIGIGLGPLPGGLLADHFGLRAPFLVYAATAGIACLAALLTLRETRPADGGPAIALAASGDGESVRSVVFGVGFILIAAVSRPVLRADGAMFNVAPLARRPRPSTSQIGGADLINVLNIAVSPRRHAGRPLRRKPVIC